MSSDSAPQGLNQKVRSAYIWTVLGNLLKQTLTLALSLLLARFLAPSDYGLVGMVLVFTNLLTTVQNLGISMAVIYFNDLESKLPTYYTATAAMGVLLTAMMYGAAPWIAEFYKNPALIPIVRALSFVLLLGGLRSVSQAQLTKSFAFRKLTLLESFSGIAAAVVAIIMAANGFGPWSLVANLLLSATLITAFVIVQIPPRFTLRIDGPVLRKILRYGLPTTGSNLLWKFYDNADYLVIGKLLGDGPLGIYTMAFRVATLVNEKISAIVTRVSFTAFAALKENRESGVSHWLSLTDKVSTINFALLALLAVLGEDLILVILGVKWMPAVLPMRILCLVGVMKTLSSITSNMLAANGRTKLVFGINVANTIILPISFLVACKLGGIVGVAIAWCLILPVTFGFMLYRATQMLEIPFSRYLGSLKFPAIIAGVCLLGPLPAIYFMDPGLKRLLLGAAMGILCGASLLIRHPWLRPRLNAFFSQRLQRVGT
jgi:teichuronic acid exporter